MGDERDESSGVSQPTGSNRQPRNDATSLAEHAGDPIWELDGDGTVTQWNRAASDILGVTEADAVGTHVSEFVPADAVDRIERLREELSRDDARRTGRLDVRLEPTDGDAIECELSVTAVTDADSAVVVARDVTERERYRTQLEARNDRLEEFASLVAHDIRNPLGIAIGRLQILREKSDSEHLATIDEAHQRIEAIVDNLLSMARTGATDEATQSVALELIAQKAWDAVDTGEATLRVDCPRQAEAQPSRLQQLFENLFRNAMDHAGPAPTLTVGAVTPMFTTTRDTDGATPTGFYVADDGPGIPREERTDVFEYGATGSDGGTGFGLGIVRDIVTEHDWDIHVTTSAGGGACFEISGVSLSSETV